jgi:chromate transporter
MNAQPTAAVQNDVTEPVGLGRFTLYFLRLGAAGFGGPIALAGYMQQTLVEERRWISRKDYIDGLALAQLAPGPLAARLAMYLGFVRGGVLGATLVAIAFILPSFLMVWGISAAYVRYGGLAWMQAVFYGVGAAVIGIIARSAYKLTRLTLGRSPLLWSIFVVLAATTAWAEREIVWLFLVAGLVPLLPRQRQSIALAAALPAIAPGSAASTTSSLVGLMWFSRKRARSSSGATRHRAVSVRGRRSRAPLAERSSVSRRRRHGDDYARSRRDHGAIYRVSCCGTVGNDNGRNRRVLPVYLFVVVPAPYFRRYGGNEAMKAFVSDVTAAASGAMRARRLCLRGARSSIRGPS